MIKRVLFDLKFFNYVIMSLYFLSACRWSISKRWPDVCYWLLSALAITATVTFLYKH